MLESTTSLSPSVSKALAEECLVQADDAYARNDLSGARDALSRALGYVPESVQLLTCLGNIQFQLNDFTGALRSFERAAIAKPDDVDILVRLANAALSSGDQEILQRSLIRALELNPAEPNALRLSANWNMEQKRYAEAAQIYFALVKAAPGDVALLGQLGKCLNEIGDVLTARWCCDRALEMDPGNALALETLSEISRLPASAHASASKTLSGRLAPSQRIL